MTLRPPAQSLLLPDGPRASDADSTGRAAALPPSTATRMALAFLSMEGGVSAAASGMRLSGACPACPAAGLRTGGRRGLARCHAAAAPPRPRPARGPPASCGARPTVARSRCSAPRLAARWRAPRCRRAASRRPLHLATWRCWAAVMITCTASRGGGTEERQTSPRCDLFKFRYEAGLRGESPGEEHSARSCPACYAVTCEATTTWMEGGLAAMASGFRAVYAVLPGKLAQHRRHSTRDSACVSKSAPDPADSECATKTRHSRYVPRKNGVHFGSI